jgi:translation elongation factor EF-1alpha
LTSAQPLISLHRYQTGNVDKRTLEKYEREAKEKNRESWYLSWAMDTNDEERAKGKTVEVGLSTCRLVLRSRGAVGCGLLPAAAI